MHYLQLIDFRMTSLKEIIYGLDNVICILKEKNKTTPWYDGLFLLEETEPILGLAFIAFQNYINGSISDYSGNLKNKNSFYQKSDEVLTFGKTKIELIVALANYSKHKDETPLHQGTKVILESCNLNVSSDVDIEDSPIFKGIELLSLNWEIFDVLEIVKDWRARIWAN